MVKFRMSSFNLFKNIAGTVIITLCDINISHKSLSVNLLHIIKFNYDNFNKLNYLLIIDAFNLTFENLAFILNLSCNKLIVWY